jgi:hypothetical protein
MSFTLARRNVTPVAKGQALRSAMHDKIFLPFYDHTTTTIRKTKPVLQPTGPGCARTAPAFDLGCRVQQILRQSAENLSFAKFLVMSISRI